MSWTPPPMRTARLTLASSDHEVLPAAMSGESIASQTGLPSNWRIHLEGQPIGMIGFLRWEREAALGEIGFFIIPLFRGRGYMMEAAQAVLAFGFDMGLQRIEAKSLPTNVASIRLLEKLGMQRGPRVQTRLSAKGALVEMDLYAIVRHPTSGDRTASAPI